MVGLNHQSDLSLIHRDDLVAFFLADSDFSEVQIIIHCCYNIKKTVGMLCIYSTFIIQLLLFAVCAYPSTDWPSVCVVLYRSIYNNVSLVPCSPSTELNCFCSSQCCFGKNLLDPWSHVLISCRHPACECFLPLGRNIISICFFFFHFHLPWPRVPPRGLGMDHKHVTAEKLWHQTSPCSGSFELMWKVPHMWPSTFHQIKYTTQHVATVGLLVKPWTIKT